MKNNKNAFKGLRNAFVSGMVVVIPVFLTVYVLVFLFRFTDNILGRFLNIYLKRWMGFYVPGLGILIAVLAILLIGFLTNRKIFSSFDKKFTNFPVVRNIYPTFKQLVAFIFSQKDFGFQKVVLVQYFAQGIWSLGFLTKEDSQRLNITAEKKFSAVFVPTSPSPFTGFVIFVNKDDLKYPEISISDAFKIIISGGVYENQ